MLKLNLPLCLPLGCLLLAVPARAGEEFTGVREVRLIHGDPASPKGKTVIISGEAAINHLVDAIKLNAKQPCACDHVDSVIFVTDKGQTVVSLCDHCFDFGGKTYAMPAAFYKLFTTYMAGESATKSATQPAAKRVPFALHDGYFVANTFEPDHAESHVVLQSQEAFDKVFGTAMVVRDKAHRLPANAFDTKLVVVVVKRGKAVVEFKVSDVTLDAGVLTVR